MSGRGGKFIAELLPRLGGPHAVRAPAAALSSERRNDYITAQRQKAAAGMGALIRGDQPLVDLRRQYRDANHIMAAAVVPTLKGIVFKPAPIQPNTTEWSKAEEEALRTAINLCLIRDGIQTNAQGKQIELQNRQHEVCCSDPVKSVMKVHTEAPEYTLKKFAERHSKDAHGAKPPEPIDLSIVDPEIIEAWKALTKRVMHTEDLSQLPNTLQKQIKLGRIPLMGALSCAVSAVSPLGKGVYLHGPVGVPGFIEITGIGSTFPQENKGALKALQGPIQKQGSWVGISIQDQEIALQGCFEKFQKEEMMANKEAGHHSTTRSIVTQGTVPMGHPDSEPVLDITHHLDELKTTLISKELLMKIAADTMQAVQSYAESHPIGTDDPRNPLYPLALMKEMLEAEEGVTFSREDEEKVTAYLEYLQGLINERKIEIPDILVGGDMEAKDDGSSTLTQGQTLLFSQEPDSINVSLSPGDGDSSDRIMLSKEKVINFITIMADRLAQARQLRLEVERTEEVDEKVIQKWMPGKNR